MHITGLTLAAGTTLVGFLVNRRFWKFYTADRMKALTVMELGARLPAVIGIGMGLLLLSGFFLMFLTKGVFAEQIWFRIKGILVILVIANSFVARSLTKRMKTLIAANDSNGLSSLKQKVNIFYIVQLLLFFSIFVLGVFKFN